MALFDMRVSSVAAEVVDVELILAVDVSLSMSPVELEIQRRGYAAALTHESVLQAIADGAYGKIAVVYFEWAGTNAQQVIVPWSVISTRDDAERLVALMSARPPNSARRTSISAALEYAGTLFDESPFEGFKQVIDISGDGPNNQGAPVLAMRNGLVERGITINGLPLMTNEGMISTFDVANLDQYYSDCVVGGPGAFMIPVNDWMQFPEAVRRKLVLEIAGVASPSWVAEKSAGQEALLVQAQPENDCLAGERKWRDRFWMNR